MVEECNITNYSIADRAISFCVCTQILIAGIKNELIQGIPFLYSINNYLNYGLILVFGLLYLNALIKARSKFIRLSRIDYAIIIVVMVTFMTTFFCFSQNVEYMNGWLIRAIIFCYITFIYIARLKTLKLIEYYMCRYAYFITVGAAIAAFYIFKTGMTVDGRDYSMSLSYVVLVGAIWHLYDYFHNKKQIALFMAIFDSFVIFLYGARNPLLAIVTYIVFQYLCGIKLSEYPAKCRKKRIIFIAIGLLMTIFIKPLFTIFVNILDRFGIYSRTLHLILVGRLSSTSGRGAIHQQLYTILDQHPFGIGIAGDMYFINESAHSVYLSIFVTYGYLLGGLVILLIAIMLIKAYRHADLVKRRILVLYACMVIPRSFIGGDIWDSDVFWWMMGIIVSILDTRKQYNKTEGLIHYDKYTACD